MLKIKMARNSKNNISLERIFGYEFNGIFSFSEFSKLDFWRPEIGSNFENFQKLIIPLNSQPKILSSDILFFEFRAI
jgi:hypothetical protein